MESHGDLVLELCPKQMCHFEWQQTNPIRLSHLRRIKPGKKGDSGIGGRGEEGSYRTQDVHLGLVSTCTWSSGGLPCTPTSLNLEAAKYIQRAGMFSFVVFKRSESKPHNARFSFCEMSKIGKPIGTEFKLVCDTQVLGGWKDWAVMAKACAFRFVVVKYSEIMMIVAQLCCCCCC